MKVPVPVNGSVPPVAETVIVVVPPLQVIVPALAEATSAVGSVIVPEVIEVHPFASVTV